MALKGLKIACSSHCIECEASGCKTCDDDYQVNTDKKCGLSSSTTTATVVESSSGLSGGAIAGVVIGSAATIVAAGYIVTLFLKKGSLSLFKQ